MVDDCVDSAYAQRNSLRGQFLRGSVDDAAERDDALIDRDGYPASIDAGFRPIERILDEFLLLIVTRDLLQRTTCRVCQHADGVGNCCACAIAANVGLPRFASSRSRGILTRRGGISRDHYAEKAQLQ